MPQFCAAVTWKLFCVWRHPSGITTIEHDRASMMCPIVTLSWSNPLPPPTARCRSLTPRCPGKGCSTGACPSQCPPLTCWSWGSRWPRRPESTSSWCSSLTTSERGTCAHVSLQFQSIMFFMFHSRVSACALYILHFQMWFRKKVTNQMVSDNYLPTVSGIWQFFLLWTKCTYRKLRTIVLLQGEMGQMWF